jgi:hypothetical protein
MEVIAIFNYIIAPTRDLVHYGKGHDDNPPGRGSGRYAWGSGNTQHGSYTPKDIVFISGKVSFDKEIPKVLKDEINLVAQSNAKIIIGDAPGADTRCQDYISKIGYRNVVVYTTDDQVRNNVGNWKVKKISANNQTEERQIRAQKDIAMSKLATKGIAISSSDDRIDSAMSFNIQRLQDSNKPIQFYDYKKQKLYPKNSTTSNQEQINSLLEKVGGTKL